MGVRSGRPTNFKTQNIQSVAMATVVERHPHKPHLL